MTKKYRIIKDFYYNYAYQVNEKSKDEIISEIKHFSKTHCKKYGLSIKRNIKRERLCVTFTTSEDYNLFKLVFAE